MNQEKVKKNALANARRWAKAGNLDMVENYLFQAQNAGHVSDRQIANLNRMLAEARAAQRCGQSLD